MLKLSVLKFFQNVLNVELEMKIRKLKKISISQGLKFHLKGSLKS